MRRFISSTLGIFLTIALLAPVAWAQGGGPPQQRQAPEPEIEASDVTDQDLDAASDILIEMKALQAKYAPKMKNAGSRKKAMKVRRQMAQQAKKIIKNNEQIKMDRYQQVMLVARQDTTLRKRLTDLVKEKSQGSQQQQDVKKDQDDS